jgi:hypothetical protein
VADLPATSAESRGTAHFRMESVVQKLGAHLDRGHDFRFNFTRPRPAVVHFTRDDPDSGAAVCAVTCVAEIEATIATKLPSIFLLSSSELAAVDNLLNDLKILLRSTIDLFRWRHGLVSGPTNATQNAQAFYSGDGKRWLEVPLFRSVAIVSEVSKSSLKDVPPEEIVRMVESGEHESVAHQLFREAWELRRSNPRSALAIGIAAVEIGVKGLIASLIPNAQWLVTEAPSPPVFKILRDYLPMLPVRARFKDKRLKPPSELITLINKGIKYRNDLVHAGASPPDWKELDTILRAVNDALWICELYGGAGWAGEYISGNTIMSWPDE